MKRSVLCWMMMIWCSASMGCQPAESFDDVSVSLAQGAVASAVVKGPEHDLKGVLYVMVAGDEVTLMGILHDLEPGIHGIHIHENGDCSAPDFSSAGGHFNPDDTFHGAPFDDNKHVGDLGNLITNEDGTAVFGIQLDDVELDDSSDSILNRALVVHDCEDDFTTQPSGAAGARVACGVIRRL